MKTKLSLINFAPAELEPWQREVLAAAERYSLAKCARMTVPRLGSMKSKEMAELIAAQRALLQIAARGKR